MSTQNDTCLTNEAVLIQSVICSKKIKLIAKEKINLKPCKIKNIQFVPDLSSIQITGTLLKDLIVIQGFIKGVVIVDGKCIKKIALSFQEEVICEDVCPGDTLKMTTPFLEGILPPQVISHEGYKGSRVIFKVILKVQATVVREKIGMVSVSLIGDINEDRCKMPDQTIPVIICEMDKDQYIHEDAFDNDSTECTDDDLTEYIDDCCESSDKW